MDGLGPWLKFSLIAWAISSAVILAVAKDIDEQLLLGIGRNLLGAVLGGLLFDWLWRGAGTGVRHKQGSFSLPKTNPAATHYNLGNTYFNNGDAGRAIESFSKALRFNPNYVDALINRGIALRKIGDYENAIADLSEALGLNPKNAGTYYYRGSVYAKQGDYRNAIADFDQALRFDPSLTEARDAKQLAQRKISEGSV